MKRVFIIFVALLISTIQLLGQVQSNKLGNFSFYPEIFTGASVMIGASVPFVSYGLGGRVYYVNPKSKFINKDYGTFADIEWNHRGGWDIGVSSYSGDEPGPMNLDYLDGSIGARVGNKFFVASGLAFGVLLKKGSGVDWPDEMNSFDMGAHIMIGYFFGEERKAFITLENKYSWINAYNNTDRFLLSNNLTWGFVFGFRIF